MSPLLAAAGRGERPRGQGTGVSDVIDIAMEYGLVHAWPAGKNAGMINPLATRSHGC